ncbi:hypothetical protein LOTGIDRAFT_171208 [Lottia gigantea]|uniref:Uncharacterized protein n=1 Tax=Lottia gigantea TaxID=225164 RepID=V4BC44_LOTGI|nr:hypothetical protein LOTGIDRAFT_171208 [Lottia gigantea]ESP03677.1 hypothetical protein LOTGIDRAFT_171208 [Lottia gigantea]
MGVSMTNVILYLCLLAITEITSEQILNRHQRESEQVVPEPETTNNTMNKTHIVDTPQSDNTDKKTRKRLNNVHLCLPYFKIFLVTVIRQRSSDIERDAKVQMNTTKNAGVYVDLATNPEEEKGDRETDKLRHTEEA